MSAKPKYDLAAARSDEQMAHMIGKGLETEYPDADVFVNQPGMDRAFGDGDHWQVAMEGGPYKWTVEMACYDSWSCFDNIHSNEFYFLEPYNHIALNIVHR